MSRSTYRNPILWAKDRARKDPPLAICLAMVITILCCSAIFSPPIFELSIVYCHPQSPPGLIRINGQLKGGQGILVPYRLDIPVILSPESGNIPGRQKKRDFPAGVVLPGKKPGNQVHKNGFFHETA